MNSVFGANSALGTNKSVTEGDSEYSGNYAQHIVPAGLFMSCREELLRQQAIEPLFYQHLTHDS